VARWTRRVRRAAEVTRVAAGKGSVLTVIRELGVVGQRPATAEAARDFRLALEELGTTWVKLGQLLSSRPDLLPDVYIEELGKLVDDVPPVPFGELEEIIRSDVGPDVFARIDEEPLAAASIGQIHTALMQDGREVVIKVRRPGVLEQVEVDLDLMRATVGKLESRSETAQLLQLEALADELESHLRGELDYLEEANNTEVIARLVAGSDDLVVPQVIRPYVTDRVLVLERIHGSKLSPAHGLPQERASELARSFFRSYVRQVTVAGIYHADPHRGNVLLTEDGRLALLDFGLLGRLDDDTRRTLALLLMAVAQNRAEDVAQLILELSLTTLESQQAGFVHDVRRKLPRYHWRPLSGIHAGEALADLQRLALQHGIRLPTSFALVGKTLSQADSIARTLDPELDPVAMLEDDSMEVILGEAERRLRPNALMSYAITQIEPLVEMPRKAAHLIDRLEEGTVKIGIAPTDLGSLDHLVRTLANRLGAAMIIVGLLISSALMADVSTTISIAGFVISGIIALYEIWRIARTPGDT